MSSNPDVRNSILWNNQDSSGIGTISATIFLTGSTSISLKHSLVEDSGGSGPNWIGSNYKDGLGNIDADPLFLEPISPATAPTTTGNLRLQAGSPAIDSGDNAFVVGLLTDLDGEPRIVDGDLDGKPIVDMGAYEYQIPDKYDGYLPMVFR